MSAQNLSFQEQLEVMKEKVPAARDVAPQEPASKANVLPVAVIVDTEKPEEKKQHNRSPRVQRQQKQTIATNEEKKTLTFLRKPVVVFDQKPKWPQGSMRVEHFFAQNLAELASSFKVRERHSFFIAERNKDDTFDVLEIQIEKQKAGFIAPMMRIVRATGRYETVFRPHLGLVVLWEDFSLSLYHEEGCMVTALGFCGEDEAQRYHTMLADLVAAAKPVRARIQKAQTRKLKK
jgi:hypothetical protein